MITAQQVKELRTATGAAMMDCKKALTETQGDITEAKQWLRRKGMADASKRSSRETGISCIHISQQPFADKAGMIEIACETEPVSQLTEFRELATAIAADAATKFMEHAALAKLWQPEINEVIAKTGENIVLRRSAFLTMNNGNIVTYTHGGDFGRCGVLVSIETNAQHTGELAKFEKDIAMHIAAKGLCNTVPVAVSREDVDAELVKEMENAFAESAKGKPENIVAKIVAGKMEKFYADNVLLEQKFVKDDSITVGEYAAKYASDNDCSMKIREFVRFEAGEEA